ncbi:MAG: acetylglutamate kinase, partial [Rhodothermia bacterium]
MSEAGETVVIKVGGGILLDAEATRSLSKGIAALATDCEVVVVHGGGPQATEMAAKMGHTPRIVHGRRVTSDLDLDLVLSTVCGVVNSQLVAALSTAGVKAVGITGASAGLVSASKRPPWTIDGEVVDFGHVGDIEKIDPAPIDALTSAGFVPVVATIGTAEDGALLNINADTTAAQIAIALNAKKLLMVTTAGGLVHEGQIVAKCNQFEIKAGVDGGWITEGMEVKLNTALEAAESGVGQVSIVGPESLGTPDAGTTMSATPSTLPSLPASGALRRAGLPAPSSSLPPPSSDPIGILETLIRFPSITGDEKQIADWVEYWASNYGLQVGRFENNVYCWLGDGDDCLLLNSHLDVVPPSSDHPYDPFDPVQKDGFMYGRGSVDAKSSGSAMLATIA